MQTEFEKERAMFVGGLIISYLCLLTIGILVGKYFL